MTNQKEKRKEPELRFPEFSGEWEEKDLSSIIDVNSGKDYKHLNRGDIPVYGTGGLMLYVDEKLSDRDGVGIGRKGSINKPQLLKAPYWTVDTLFYCIPKINNDLYYIYTLYQKINWLKYDESTGVPSLSKATINKIKQYFPEYKEQQKIGEFFSKLDRQIELEEKKLALLEEQKKGYMQKIFSQELRFKDENGEEYPEWDKCRLEEICTLTMGFTPSTKNEEFWNGDLPWLSIAGMNSKYTSNGSKNISEIAIKNKKIVKKGTLLMSFKLSIGNLTILKEDMYTNEAICHFNWNNNSILNEFVYYYLKTIDIKSYGSRAAKGITLNSENLNSILIEKPAIKEQNKIANMLSKLDEKIEKQKLKLLNCNKRKTELLRKVLI
ncbi:restriction endonuclease subunit S [Macrococcoides canis]|uniref:restriction endonuclease subunit S n=1 Tax=Macrococcoides canis TaxID=1855823 RepID=UPI00207D1AEA|nr:restriction endonuclease subunit S [Macrococcus canis]MCO4097053.1 restriction endonuclease subunit S [Macrococcus canis]UTH09689.1 restriction endonuclease subunit S [Macrococcus canis]